MLPERSKPAAIRAARAAIVMPGAFVIAEEVVGNAQMALFAAFGSFATLVLVSFGGTWREKLRAHLGLAVLGSVLLTIGTAVNSTTALAALVTIPVAFAVFFAGVAGPNAASGVTGALLAYVLPAATPGTIGMVPDRLAGWWLASGTGTLAVLVLASPPVADRLREAALGVTAVLADALDALLRDEASEQGLRPALEAKHALLSEFEATPYRPTGLAVRDQALADAIELLEWCTSLVIDCVRERAELHHAAPPERELLRTSAEVLRESGTLLVGGEGRADLARLDALRRESIAGLQELAPLSPGFEEQARLAFHAHAIAATVLAIGLDALLVAGNESPVSLAHSLPGWLAEDPARPRHRRGLRGLRRYRGVVAPHASLRSVWFINSMRGALALSVAVAVADLSGAQHGFWVVLGTLSVLRTSAAATGATALRALLGTAVGFAIGAALLLVIGTSSTALWVALPFAVAIAAYAPGVAPFAVGQAAFTITIVVLFNLLVPVGWKVGELRIEDVALGCLVSVLVGGVFWPHGVASVVADDLADAYRTGVAYLRQAVDWVCGRRGSLPDVAGAALATGVRLDEALRAFLVEQGTKHLQKQELWRLVGGTLRLRLTAHAVAALPRECAREAEDMRAGVGERLRLLGSWYEQLAEQLGRPARRPPAALAPPPLPDPAAGPGPRSEEGVWLREYLDHLLEHLGELAEPAAHVARYRDRPWWR
jgi:uncharacterized membrane protein YgaE (UPF0421/DUF939 family)